MMIPVIQSSLSYNPFLRYLVLFGKRLVFVKKANLQPVFRGEHLDRFLAHGYHFINPWREKLGMPSHAGFRNGQFIFKNVQTKDHIQINIEIRVMYNLKANRAMNPYKAMSWSTDISNSIIENIIESTIRNIINDITAENLHESSQIERITGAIRKTMTENDYFGISLFDGPGVSIGKITFPKEYRDALAIKLQAQALAEFSKENSSFNSMQELAFILRTLPTNETLNSDNSLLTDLLALSHLRDLQAEKNLPQSPLPMISSPVE